MVVRVSCLLAAILYISPALAADGVDYERDVKPLLKARCYVCHGAVKQEGTLRLDTGASIRKGGDSGSAVDVGDATASLIVARVSAPDEKDRMPPEGEPLSKAQVSLLSKWIEEGAKSPVDEKPQSDPREHWAYRPVARPQLPQVGNPAWARSAIDTFLLARLERAGITPAPEADRTTLVRRLYLDLLGLPPQPDEVDEFVQDRHQNAWDRLVDRVLASPAFGERWGRHWLDLARYADSNGYEDDRMRPDAWRFRDWVIAAVNSDLPFDQFTVCQLAGDLLPDASYDQRVATGFHRMTLSNEGGADSVEEEFRIIAVKDRVDTTGSVWLGLSVGCAKCHTHKYDPITHHEYYRLFVFFNSAEDTSTPAPPLPRRFSDEYTRKTAALNQRINDIKKSLAVYEQNVLAEKIQRWQMGPGLDAELLADIRKLLEVSAERRTQKDQLKLADMLSAIDPDYSVTMGNEVVNSGNNRPLPPSSQALVVAAKPRASHVHRRGSFLDLGDEVSAGTPEFLPPLHMRGETADRLDLARWIVDERNPLTSRVAANHFWRRLFGRGLVASPDEFGVTGSPPSHPELLDWLAVELIRRGWSPKVMIRQIVTSAAYRQSSRLDKTLAEFDPENLLLARQSRQRVEAECIRDLALAAAGILNRAVGGPSFQPPLPDGLMQLEELKNEQFLESSTGTDRYRRGVYVHVQRMFLLPMLQTFDAADPNATCARRERSNTPLQALTLLNDPVFMEAAQALGRRVVTECQGGVGERIRSAFRLCHAREPNDQERATLERLFDQHLRICRDTPSAAAELAGDGPWPEGVSQIEAAAWIGLARTILNLDEFITRE